MPPGQANPSSLPSTLPSPVAIAWSDFPDRRVPQIPTDSAAPSTSLNVAPSISATATRVRAHPSSASSPMSPVATRVLQADDGSTSAAPTPSGALAITHNPLVTAVLAMALVAACAAVAVGVYSVVRRCRRRRRRRREARAREPATPVLEDGSAWGEKEKAAYASSLVGDDDSVFARAKAAKDLEYAASFSASPPPPPYHHNHDHDHEWRVDVTAHEGNVSRWRRFLGRAPRAARQQQSQAIRYEHDGYSSIGASTADLPRARRLPKGSGRFVCDVSSSSEDGNSIRHGHGHGRPRLGDHQTPAFFFQHDPAVFSSTFSPSSSPFAPAPLIRPSDLPPEAPALAPLPSAWMRARADGARRAKQAVTGTPAYVSPLPSLLPPTPALGPLGKRPRHLSLLTDRSESEGGPLAVPPSLLSRGSSSAAASSSHHPVRAVIDSAQEAQDGHKRDALVRSVESWRRNQSACTDGPTRPQTQQTQTQTRMLTSSRASSSGAQGGQGGADSRSRERKASLKNPYFDPRDPLSDVVEKRGAGGGGGGMAPLHRGHSIRPQFATALDVLAPIAQTPDPSTASEDASTASSSSSSLNRLVAEDGSCVTFTAGGTFGAPSRSSSVLTGPRAPPSSSSHLAVPPPAARGVRSRASTSTTGSRSSALTNPHQDRYDSDDLSTHALYQRQRQRLRRNGTFSSSSSSASTYSLPSISPSQNALYLARRQSPALLSDPFDVDAMRAAMEKTRSFWDDASRGNGDKSTDVRAGSTDSDSDDDSDDGSDDDDDDDDHGDVDDDPPSLSSRRTRLPGRYRGREQSPSGMQSRRSQSQSRRSSHSRRSRTRSSTTTKAKGRRRSATAVTGPRRHG